MNLPKVLAILAALAWATACGAQGEGIHRVVRRGDLAELAKLVASSPGLVNDKGEDGDTPLHVAAITGRTEAALFLVAKGADVEARNSADQSPLLYAAYAGNAALVDTLIARGAQFDYRDARGSGPIHFAARQGKTAVVELLLAKGASFDERGNQGRTPLYLAAANGHTEIVRRLASRGAKLDTKDDAGRTPMAAALGAGRVETAEYLLDAGLEIEGDADALSRFVHLAAAAGSQRIVDALAARGASLDGADEAGRTLLHEAAIGGLPGLAKTMIARGGSLDEADAIGRTALHYAAAGDRVDVAGALLDGGADANVADSAGRTPLHIAEDSGWPEIANLLRERGARDVERRVHRLTRGAAAAARRPGPPLDISYIANEGFMISRGDKKILIDALHRNPWNYIATGERILSMILDGRPPFDGIDLSVASHAHADHMSARMNVDLLERNPRVAFVSSPEALDSMRSAAGPGFGKIAERVVAVDPPWTEIERLQRNGVDLEIFGINHAGPGERPYKTLATVVDLDGIRLVHIADQQSGSNAENFRGVDLAGGGVDIAFADRMMLTDSVGQYILKELVKPEYIILMHAQRDELDSAARDLLPLHPNLIIFREQLERRRFSR